LEFDVVFTPAHNMLRVRVWGAEGPNLVEEMVTAIRSAPEFDPGIGVLIDALNTDYAPDTSEAIDFPAFFEAQLPGSRLALIVRDGPQYNVACVVEAVASRGEGQFAVFRDRTEAIRWLTESPRERLPSSWPT
jgi:hypothetical protein